MPNHSKPGGFTITSTPSMAAREADPYLELAVQHAPENPAAAWLWRSEKEIVGKELSVRIGGSFVLPPSEGFGKIKRIVLVAGGVGINPLVSMLGYLTEQRLTDMNVSVLYTSKLPGDKSLNSILFLSRIAEYFRGGEISGGITLFVTGNNEKALKIGDADELGIGVHTMRMSTGNIVGELRKSSSPDENVVYICGPPSMTDEFVDALTAPTMSNIIHPTNVKKEKWW